MTDMNQLLRDIRAFLVAESFGPGGTRDDEGLCARIDEALGRAPAPHQQYRVHVQRNVIGLDAGLGYPANIELMPHGPTFDTKDAATLWGASHGWMDLWWNVQAVRTENT